MGLLLNISSSFFESTISPTSMRRSSAIGRPSKPFGCNGAEAGFSTRSTRALSLEVKEGRAETPDSMEVLSLASEVTLSVVVGTGLTRSSIEGMFFGAIEATIVSSVSSTQDSCCG